jgi:hypothetical protein
MKRKQKRLMIGKGYGRSSIITSTYLIPLWKLLPHHSNTLGIPEIGELFCR